MTAPAVFAPAALEDLRQAMAWISRDNPAAARALRDAALHAARRLGTHPQLGAIRPRLAAPRYRFLLLRGFPYVAVYTAETSPPRILRVLHGARDIPGLLG